MEQRIAAERGADPGEDLFADGEGSRPSPVRAWFYLVGLSFQRQARVRQMVWIAGGLLACAVLLVAVNTARNRWGMHHWRWPWRRGHTYVQWIDETQVLLPVIHRSAGAQAVESGVLGACRAIVARSAFLVFSRWMVFGIFLSFLLPIWSLSFATEALGGERESGSLVWLLTRPLSRPAIYLARFVALLPWSIGLNVGGFALICLAGGEAGRLAFRLFWPAVLCASLAFSALFFFLGTAFRRPAVAAIAYSFFLETVLGNMPGTVKRLSVGFYTRCMMFQAAEGYGVQPEKPSVFLPVDGPTALAVLVLATVGLLALGTLVFARSQYHEVV